MKLLGNITLALIFGIEDTRHAMLLPSSMEIQARGHEYGVIHFLAKNAQTLGVEMSSHLGLDLTQSEFLCGFGSVYVNHKRVLDPQFLLNSGDYLRVHSKPRRFRSKNLEIPILFENENFVVVAKPSGLPCHASVDNIQENLLSLLSQKIKHELFITHRLDVATQGLLLLAKTKAFQSEFNFLLQQRLVEKIYSARVEGHCQHSGVITHWMKPSPRAPKEVFIEPAPNYDLCELEILSNAFHKCDNSTELKIKLMTGRTHQIRAQLSKLGFPIVGDIAYGAKLVQSEFEWIALRSSYLKFLEFEFNLLPDQLQK